MRTQQDFFKYKTRPNFQVINSSLYNNNIIRNNYNNYSSINKYNTLYANKSNSTKRSYDFNNNSNRRINTENDYMTKSQNYFAKNYKSVNTVQRKPNDYSISNSISKRVNKIIPNFYLSNNNFNNKNIINNDINEKNNLPTLPSIKTGFQVRNNHSQTRTNTNPYNTSKNFNGNNYLNNNIQINNIKVISSVNKNNNNLNSLNNQTYNHLNNNLTTNRYFSPSSDNAPPRKLSVLKNTNYRSNSKSNNHNNSNNTNIFNNSNNIYSHSSYNTYSLKFLLKEKYSLYKDAKCSERAFSLISAYGVNTYRGTVRNYNEDRISVVVNANNNYQKLKNSTLKISFFAIYDGHAGNKCCEFLKNNLHNYIFESTFFPSDPIKAIEQGFNLCEKRFIDTIHVKNRSITRFKNKVNQFSDYSGSCAIVVLIINETCYIANLGDSRALYSYDSGNQFFQLSRDHKPNDKIEKDRIYKAGGSIFKTNIAQYGVGLKESDLGFTIPFRILPGRLAVSKYLNIYLLINI